MDRRGFLRAAAGAALAMPLALGAVGTARADDDDDDDRRVNVPRSKIGIQLYSVRDQMERDAVATMTAIARIGYREVEWAGLYGRSPEEWRRILKRLGLRSPSSHNGVGEFENEPERMLEAARTLGQRWVIVPFVPPSTTLDGYRRLAETLNEVGALARRYGIRTGYHNHSWEFEPKEGTFPYAVLLEETDPRLVDMELDLYWAIEGYHTYNNPEALPLALFERAPRRFPLFHVKDGFPSRPGVQFADVGEGEIDFAPIFAAKAKSGVKHYITERDDAPSDPEGSLGSAEDMYDNLVAEYSAGRRRDD